MAKKKKKEWIAGALTGQKGALKKVAKRKGILTEKHDKLTKRDLHKLEDMGGKTAKRAHFVETLMSFEDGGELMSLPTKELAKKMGMSMAEVNKEGLDRDDLLALLANETFRKGGKLKSTNWIKKALSGHKGKLKTYARRKGILHGKHDTLTIKDLHKIEKSGGISAKRAHLAETLMSFNKKEDGGVIESSEDIKKILKHLKEGESIDVYYGGEWHNTTSDLLNYADSFDSENSFLLDFSNQNMGLVEGGVNNHFKIPSKEFQDDILEKYLVSKIKNNGESLSEKVVEEIKEAVELKKDIVEDISKIVLKDGTEIESEELKDLIANDFKMDVQTDEELVHKFLEGGEIHTHQLREIIGREPNHHETIGNTKLQKCWCRHKYRKAN